MLRQHDDVPLATELSQFQATYPDYSATRLLDELRATDYARLDEQDHCYLDYTGGGLYAIRQLQAHMDLLTTGVFGNPHSDNPTSRAMTAQVEAVRACALDYFQADPAEYVAIFTPNASGALKLVGESYPFTPASHYLLTYDNHNSVNGLREFARARGATTTYVPVRDPDLRLDEVTLRNALESPKAPGKHLFAYPAQSNFSGVQHPLEWIERAQVLGWDVLLDGAAFAPTNGLDLHRWHPDFVSLSFYKLFGYPTGVGCLLARRAALKHLRRPWFAGGTIWAASVESDHIFMAEDEAAFEDGTVNYLTLPAIEIGLRFLQSIGIATIHCRVMCLTGWLLAHLRALHHSNGRPLVKIYGPRNTIGRGATIALNFLDPSGAIVDERFVDQRASAGRISLRTGCFCNPGAGEVAFSLSPARVGQNFQRANRPGYDEFLRLMGLPSGGAVRVSLGLATNFADIHRFLAFARTFLDQIPDATGLPERHHC